MSKAKKIGTCNAFSRVFAAIFGCEGKGAFSGWEPTMHGSPTPNYTCHTCAAARTMADAGFEANRLAKDMTVGSLHNAHAIHQAFLLQAQELAGVENYRYQGTFRAKDGRPGLVNRREGREWFMPSILTRWTDFRPVDSQGQEIGR